MRTSLRAALQVALFISFESLFVTSCSDGASPPSGAGALDASVSLRLTGLQKLPIPTDSVVFDVSASGMASVHQVFAQTSGSFVLESLLPGPSRRFLATLYGGSVPLQQGEIVADLAAGATTSLSLQLEALAAWIHVDVPLGVDSAAGQIHSGSIRLVRGQDTVQATLKGVGPVRSFDLGPVPFGTGWTLELALLSASGDTVHLMRDTLDLLRDGEWPLQLQLKSNLGSVQLDLVLDTVGMQSAVLLLPGSHVRGPGFRGELRFTEILANPKVNGNDWEWMELVNTTSDTLALSGCRIRKDVSSSTASTALTLDSSLWIAPGAFLVLGRDSVPFADWSYHEFTLSNSGQGLRLDCGSLLLDSLQYVSPTDSVDPWPLVAGKSMQLSLDSLVGANNGKRWCAGVDSVRMSDSLTVLSSPGRDAVCD